MSRPLQPCIFCPNPRTNKRGEHLWDDWLNRVSGIRITVPGVTSYWGHGGEFIRSHPSAGLNVTIPVVCDECNNNWMSELTTRASVILEPMIRHDNPTALETESIVAICAFAFMKSAVLDWSAIDNGRVPVLSRSACIAFKDHLVFPDGLQIWLARYRRFYVMEAKAFNEELAGARQFQRHRILVITYLVGSFIFQLTCPRWAKRTRNHGPAPFFEIVGDLESVPIWPDVTDAYWPPPLQITRNTLDRFRERFRHIQVPRRFH